MSNVIKLVLLLVGSILVLFIAKTVISLSTRGPEQAPPEAKIRVSAADLPQGLLLRDDDLQWKAVAPDKIPPNAIVAGAPGTPDLKGALLRHAVTADTVLHSTDVILPNAPGFLAATLKPGMLAVSVAVDDVSGNAGLIEPGDDVDLILTQQAPDNVNGNNARSFVSETVLQHVRVLASGMDLERPKNPDGSNNDQRRAARTVTLEVTPHMSEVVSVAGRLGSLSLALRSFATTSRDVPGAVGASGLQGIAQVGAASDALPPPVWSRDVTRALMAPAPPPGAPVRSAPIQRPVMIYRGSARDAQADPTAAAPTGATTGAPPLPPGLMAPQGQ